MDNQLMDIVQNFLRLKKKKLIDPQPDSFSTPMPNFDQQMAVKGWTKQADGSYYQGETPAISPSSPSITQTPQAPSNWSSKYQKLWDQAIKQKGLAGDIAKLLVTSENGKEDPVFKNYNSNNTVDVGLGQVNAPVNDLARIKALEDPTTNINTATDIYKQRLQNLGDPLLALASYNLGATGAVTNPQKALARAQKLYTNANLPIPQTAFSQNPALYIKQHLDQYKKLGIVQ